MSQANYDQYGGNPYASSGGYGASDPYGTTGGTTQTGYTVGGSGYATEAGYGQSGYGQSQGAYDTNGAPGGVVHVQAPPTTLSNQEFLTRVEGIRGSIRQLTTNVSEVGVLHQRVLSDPTSSHAQLDNLVSNTQILNTKIRDEIRQLEADALKSRPNTTKESQIRTLKGHFKSQLEDYQQQEVQYQRRYQDQIAREYKIVNPEATDAEVQEAATANWGNEGIFQTALKTNRSAAANSVLGNVRARHNDIQRIEKSLTELAQIFNDLAVQVELQEAPIQQAEEETVQVHKDTEAGNKQLNTAIKHAITRRKLQWWCFWITLAIIAILALILGLYFGLPNAGYHANSSNNNNN